MVSTNLKIVDQEFLFAEKVLLTYLDVLKETGEAYINILDDVSSYALQVPVINETLVSLSVAMVAIIKGIEKIAEYLKGSANGFIGTVDVKDDFLY